MTSHFIEKVRRAAAGELTAIEAATNDAKPIFARAKHHDAPAFEMEAASSRVISLPS
jgi:hypothetical protein